MWDVIRTLVADGTTILLTTQYLDEADKLAQRIAVVDQGRVIAEGTPDELKASVGGAKYPDHRGARVRPPGCAGRARPSRLRTTQVVRERRTVAAPFATGPAGCPTWWPTSDRRGSFSTTWRSCARPSTTCS